MGAVLWRFAVHHREAEMLAAWRHRTAVVTQAGEAGEGRNMTRHNLVQMAAGRPEGQRLRSSLGTRTATAVEVLWCSAGHRKVGLTAAAAVQRPRCSCWTWLQPEDPVSGTVGESEAGYSKAATAAAHTGGRTVAAEGEETGHTIAADRSPEAEAGYMAVGRPY